MRKLLFALAACVLCAAPLKAQSAALAPEAQPAAEAAAPAPQHAPKPSLYPTTDEVRRQVASTERERAQGQKSAISNDFLYLVAAIVVGVVIAALILD
ncbi:MAG: hypothetical protein ACJ8GN_08455 [Longimicrobiaceae bacterium]